ncbi:MAG: tRNA pseudouridine(38-40) synthase TruA [Saprospiraceae bacterium]
MTKYFIRLSYDGTGFNGWQKQPVGQGHSVQTEVESALSSVLRQPVEITGCGRTDAGVHAENFISHFESDDHLDTTKTVFILNKMLSKQIGIHAIYPVHDDAHARFDAISRSYTYRIHTQKDPFALYSWYYPYGDLNLETLNKAAALIMEFEDFSTFCKTHSDVKTTICHISESYWLQNGKHYEYHIKADRFLRGMIRLIVGMCVQICRQKLTIDDVRKAMQSGVKTGRDWSVPAAGLTLHDISYPYFVQLSDEK